MFKQLLVIATMSMGLNAMAADELDIQALGGRDPVAYQTEGKAWTAGAKLELKRLRI